MNSDADAFQCGDPSCACRLPPGPRPEPVTAFRLTLDGLCALVGADSAVVVDAEGRTVVVPGNRRSPAWPCKLEDGVPYSDLFGPERPGSFDGGPR